MDTTKVPAPDPWAEIAAELRRIADDSEHLIGEPAPSCFQIHIQPKPHDVREAVAAVDTIALSLLGKPGETKHMHDDTYHRNATAYRGPIEVAVYRKVPEPHDAELKRLRARVAELEADRTGLAYTRADDEPDDPTPVSPARVPMHTGAVTDGGLLVDETSAEPGAAIAADASITGAAVTDSCVFVGDKGGFCTTHDAVHIASGVGECGCPVYPFAGRGDAADMIIDHRRACPDHPSES